MDAFGVHTIKTRFTRRSTMTDLMKYNAANFNQLLDRINRNSIGMDEYFDRLFNLHETTTNYPPYNLVTVSNVESRLELALAGSKRKKFMSTHKTVNSLSKDKRKTKRPEQNTSIEEWPEIFHQNLTLSDETEVRSVVFEDGLPTLHSVKLSQITIKGRIIYKS